MAVEYERATLQHSTSREERDIGTINTHIKGKTKSQRKSKRQRVHDRATPLSRSPWFFQCYFQASPTFPRNCEPRSPSGLLCPSGRSPSPNYSMHLTSQFALISKRKWDYRQDIRVTAGQPAESQLEAVFFFLRISAGTQVSLHSEKRPAHSPETWGRPGPLTVCMDCMGHWLMSSFGIGH